MYNVLEGYGIDKLGPDKYLYLTVPVTPPPLDYIGYALVPSTTFEIVSLVEAALIIYTPRV